MIGCVLVGCQRSIDLIGCVGRWECGVEYVCMLTY